MILIDIVFELIFTIYTCLGFGSKEYKIQTKIEKLAKHHPWLLAIYQKHQQIFETDDEIITYTLKLNLKCESDINQYLDLITRHFNCDVKTTAYS